MIRAAMEAGAGSTNASQRVQVHPRKQWFPSKLDYDPE